MSKKKIKIDEFHHHEALDRTYTIGYIGEELLMKHPIFLIHKNLRKKAKKALQLFAEIYQELGSMEIRKQIDSENSENQ